MYSNSHDIRQHLIRSHPDLKDNVKPNVPLSPLIIDTRAAIEGARAAGGGSVLTPVPASSRVLRPRKAKRDAAAATAAAAGANAQEGDHGTADPDFACGDLEINLGALNAAEVPIEELESSVFLEHQEC